MDGRAQLTLVEHALCPIDASAGLREGLVHRTEFFYVDANRHRRTASARVVCPFGLSPGDEFYLWGLIALTLSQPDPSVEFHATPHYCLGELGVIDGAKGRGGKNYALFRQAITRLAAVTYLNDHFYDPVRGEHREVAFGVLSYSLPADPASSRAWRIVWDPIFFEFCRASGGALAFDLETYRALDFASRRLFLLLKKIFWRNPLSPSFDVRHLGVNVLGFAPTVDVRDLKIKLTRAVERLVAHGVVAAPEAGGAGGLFEKKGVGSYTVRLRRGAYFEKAPAAGGAARAAASPLRDPLQVDRLRRRRGRADRREVQAPDRPGLGRHHPRREGEARRFLQGRPGGLLPRQRREGLPGERTPPDWWYDHRKEERRRGTASPGGGCSTSPTGRRARTARRAYLRGEGGAAFANSWTGSPGRYRDAGRSPGESERDAAEAARAQLRNRFRGEFSPPNHADPPPSATSSKITNSPDRRRPHPDDGPAIDPFGLALFSSESPFVVFQWFCNKDLRCQTAPTIPVCRPMRFPKLGEFDLRLPGKKCDAGSTPPS